MDATAVTFLVIGGIGAGVLVLSLLVGEIGGALHLSADADGPFSVPAIAALIGGIGFGGAAAISALVVRRRIDRLDLVSVLKTRD